MGYLIGILLVVMWYVARIAYQTRPRRKCEPGFEYVYVNQDGSVREISPSEQAYLSETFEPFDSGRPYIKIPYEELDGWGSLSGFIARRHVPEGKDIQPVNPLYDALFAAEEENRPFDFIEDERVIRESINENGGELTTEARLEILRRLYLERQRRREQLAKYPESRH